MTSDPFRDQTALLVIDMQKDVVAGAYELDQVVGNINTLVSQARAADVPVIWVQHADEELPHGSDGWQYIDELTRHDDEPLIHKTFGDSFAETELEEVLAARNIGQVVVTGAQTDACIRSTLHGALVRGYDVTLASDAHTTEDMRAWGSPLSPEQAIAYTNMYWQFSKTSGATGQAVPTADIDLAASSS